MLQNFHITNKLEGDYLMLWLVLVQKKIKVHISLTYDQRFNERDTFNFMLFPLPTNIRKKETVSCVVRHSDHDQLDCIKIPALLSQDSVPLGKVIVSLNLIFFI